MNRGLIATGFFQGTKQKKLGAKKTRPGKIKKKRKKPTALPKQKKKITVHKILLSVFGGRGKTHNCPPEELCSAVSGQGYKKLFANGWQKRKKKG